MASNEEPGAAGGTTKRKHNTISIQDKVEVIRNLDRGVPVRQLCEMYGIGKTTVVDIKRQREKILTFYTNSDSKKQMSVRKTMKDSRSTVHDRVMIEWVRQRQNDGVDLSGRTIKYQAKLFHRQLKLKHRCDYTDGWLNKFKKRHGVSFQKCGENRSANQEEPNELVEEFSKYTADENLNLEACNADETSIDCRGTPRKTQVADEVEAPMGFKREPSEEKLTECVQVDNETPIAYQRRDTENLDSSMMNEIDDEANYVDVAAGLNIDRLIELITELIRGLGQHYFVTEPELMNFHLMHEKLHRERSKCLMRQIRLEDMVKKKKRTKKGNFVNGERKRKPKSSSKKKKK